jgi:RNA polymerase sigma-70 factor (ECF subfamily)
MGLALMDGLAEEGSLATYPYLHAGRADLLRRLGRHAEAAAAYRHALTMTANRAERSFLEGRLIEVAGKARTGASGSAPRPS